MEKTDWMNQGYQKLLDSGVTEIGPNESLKDFLENEQVLWSMLPNGGVGLNVLELGSGLKSLFDGHHYIWEKNWNASACDIASVAVSFATTEQSGPIYYFDADVSCDDLGGPYDLILDGHCLHTITETSERESFFSNVKKTLDKDGVFVLEHMISHKKMWFEEDVLFDEQKEVLHKSGRPFRKIPTALSLENELLSNGLQIVFLMAYSSLKVIPFDNRDVALESDPDTIRIICRRGEN